MPFQIFETHFLNMEYAYFTIEKRIFQIFEKVYCMLFYYLFLLTELESLGKLSMHLFNFANGLITFFLTP